MSWLICTTIGTVFCVIDEEKERQEVLARLCVSKCTGMDLGNHKHAYTKLKELPLIHKENLKRMGYGTIHL